MNRLTISILLLGFLAGIFFTPNIVSAQQPTQTQINAAASSQVRDRFNPNAKIQGNNTIKGIQFAGVGGAIAGCYDVGGKIVNGISTLFPKKASKVDSKAVSKFNFGSKTGVGTSSVPVSSPKGANDNFQVIQENLSKADKREACLDGVAYAVAKGMLHQVTNKVLNWANNGFGGDPLYVPQLDRFLEKISDKKIRQFLDDIPRDDPIFGSAIRSVVTESVSGIQDGFIDVAMDTPQARRYQEFQKDFNRGGWGSFLNPNNNPLSALFDSIDNVGENIGNEQQNTKAELDRNGGFLDMKFCVKYAEDTRPASPRYCEDLGPDDDYNGCVSRGQFQAKENSGPDCLEWESVTPGSVIASQVSEVTGSTIRQLEQADEINEVLGSFFDQMLSGLLSKGLSSLGDKQNKNFKSTGLDYSAVNGTRGGSNTSASAGIDAFGYEEADGRTRIVDFDISRPQQIRAILQAQVDYLNRMRDARASLVRIVPTLGALDYCIPGPNPTWRDNFSDNAETYFDTIQVVERNSTLFTQIIQSIPLIGGFFGGGESHTIAAVGTTLFDKVSDAPVDITDTVYHENNRSTGAIFTNVQTRYNEVASFYDTTYTPAAIESAFVAVDPTHASYATGFVKDAFAETANLPSYAAGSAELDEYYLATDADTKDAIRELETINAEVNSIVSTAKTRYITERAATGNPVVLSCIDRAYEINTSTVVPVPRLESDAPSPFLDRFLDASRYFYTQL